MFIDAGTNTGYYRVNFFGDGVSYKAGDAYHALLAGDSAANGTSAVQILPQFCTGLGSTLSQNTFVVARGAAQTGSAIRATLHSFGLGGTSIGATAGPLYPSPVDNGTIVSRPVLFNEDSVTFGHPIRGIMPGLAAPLAKAPFGEKEIVGGLVGDANTYLSIPLLSANAGNMLIDLTSDWH